MKRSSTNFEEWIASKVHTLSVVPRIYVSARPQAQTLPCKSLRVATTHAPAYTIFYLIDINDHVIHAPGFRSSSPLSGLYRRDVIDATGKGLSADVKAYIYHQTFPKETKDIINFPNGDWMEVR